MINIIIPIALIVVGILIVIKSKSSDGSDYDDATKEYYESKKRKLNEYDAQQLERELIALITDGNKIKAIKTYREATGADLKTCKEYIDQLDVNIC